MLVNLLMYRLRLKKALKSYKSLAQAGNYPTSEQTRNMDAKELANLKKLIETTEKSKSTNRRLKIW